MSVGQRRLLRVPELSLQEHVVGTSLFNAKVIWLLPLLSVQSASNRDQHYTPDMTPFLGVIYLLPGSRLIILDQFQNGRDVLLLLEYTLTLDMDLLSQHAMLLSKLSSMELQNTSPL